jgi:hypothetical protein
MTRLKTYTSKCLAGTFAIACLAAYGTVCAAPVDLIVNGGFEQTTLTNSGQITQTNVTGWSNTASGNLGHFNFVYFPNTADQQGALVADPNPWYFKLWGPGTGSNNGLPASSPTGGNFLAGDGDSQFRAPISQLVTGLTIGSTYDLHFYYAGAQQQGKYGATTESWQVGFGNDVQSTPILNDVSMGFTGWRQIDMLFTATSTQQLLSFLAIGTPNGLPPISLLDGVSLTQVSLVPEPASLALMALGLLGLGGSTARARRNG